MEEEEDNDTLSQADLHDPLCENRDVFGWFPDEEENDDIYVIKSRGGTFTLRLTNIPAGTDYDLELYRGLKRLDFSRNESNQAEEITYTGEAGKYYARVYRYEGSSPDHYVIRWEGE